MATSTASAGRSLFYHGLVAQPGTSSSLISLRLGWFVAAAGTLLMLSGSALRASNIERKPPGML